MFQSLLTYIWGGLLFEWVEKSVASVSIASVSMGTYICGVLVFDGYLYCDGIMIREVATPGVCDTTNLKVQNHNVGKTAAVI